MKYLKQNAGRPHAEKLLSTIYASHSISRGNVKNLMPRSFTFVCQLYRCSSKHGNNKALRIMFNSCKTVSTSSVALATVNIDSIIKVTSASSYVYIAIYSGMVDFIFFVAGQNAGLIFMKFGRSWGLLVHL